MSTTSVHNCRPIHITFIPKLNLKADYCASNLTTKHNNFSKSIK